MDVSRSPFQTRFTRLAAEFCFFSFSAVIPACRPNELFFLRFCLLGDFVSELSSPLCSDVSFWQRLTWNTCGYGKKPYRLTEQGSKNREIKSKATRYLYLCYFMFSFILCDTLSPHEFWSYVHYSWVIYRLTALSSYDSLHSFMNFYRDVYRHFNNPVCRLCMFANRFISNILIS